MIDETNVQNAMYFEVKKNQDEHFYLLSSRTFFNCRSNILLESQNPCLVFPKELGPADVCVSLEINACLKIITGFKMSLEQC